MRAEKVSRKANSRLKFFGFCLQSISDVSAPVLLVLVCPQVARGLLDEAGEYALIAVAVVVHTTLSTALHKYIHINPCRVSYTHAWRLPCGDTTLDARAAVRVLIDNLLCVVVSHCAYNITRRNYVVKYVAYI